MSVLAPWQEGPRVPKAGPTGPLLHGPPPSQQGRRVSRPRAHTPRGRQAWLAAKATVRSLTPSARSHRRRPTCRACRAHARHTRPDDEAGRWRPRKPLAWSVLMAPGGGEGGPAGGRGLWLTEGAQESLGLPGRWGDHGGRGGESTATPPQAAWEERRPIHLHRSSNLPPAHALLSTHPP